MIGQFKGRDACRESFTLVELLVVISIISVLAALLMPALGSAKDRSKAVVCGTIKNKSARRSPVT